ncbi:MAG: cytochrome b [Pseudorhodobacter sp.]|nr:cytochrome b [Pseudorhodobacter sp.]
MADMEITVKPHFASVSLHWIGALLLLFALLGGLYTAYYAAGCCSTTDKLVFLGHAYAGLTVLIVAVARLSLRAAFTWPKPRDKANGRIGTVSAVLVHLSLYAVMILIPLTGWIMASAMPCCWRVPGLPDVRVLSFGIGNSTTAGFGSAWQTHVILAWITIGLILMHVGAAIFNHFVLRNDTLRSMLPGRLRNQPKVAYHTPARP